jgi:DNA processing protein
MATTPKILEDIPDRLLEISDPPKQLNYKGTFPDGDVRYLAVVGSRKFTNYGKDACESMIAGLEGYPIVIVSGLALGIDTIAHESALRAGLKTIAIPGSGLGEKVLYPRSNFALANKILRAGGCLLSEFDENFAVTNWSFPMRNRIMAALSHAVLIIEAEEKSGSLITARLGMEYNRDVLVLPGPVFSPQSIGTNALLKDGAHPCTSSKDILEILGFKEQERVNKNYDNCTDEERVILELLYEPTSKEELMQKYPGSVTDLNMILSLLEIKGHIKETMGEIRKV